MSILEICATVVGVLLVLLILEILRCKYVIRTTETSVHLKNLPLAWDGVRIIQVSDLHDKSFGAKNRRLAEKVIAVHPDYILCTGDIIDCYHSDDRSFFDFVKQLEDAAPKGSAPPIFLSLGNHEARLMLGSQSFPWDFAREIAACKGVTVLDNAAVTVTRNGESVTFAGYSQPLDTSDPYRDPLRRFYRSVTACDIQLVLQKPTSFTLLLAHNPNAFDAYSAWGADITFSGHVHGGMWRLFGRGLLSPNVTFFPPYTSGMYSKGDKKMYVSRGLSSSHLPRLFNAPHLPVIILQCH